MASRIYADRIQIMGYQPREGSIADVSLEAQNEDYGLFTKSVGGGYCLSPEQLDALNRVMDFAHDGTQVVVVEMPLTETSFALFDTGRGEYNLFLDTVSQDVEEHGIPFIFTTSGDFPELSPEFWYDHLHFNDDGASLFSEWLGQRVGEIILESN